MSVASSENAAAAALRFSGYQKFVVAVLAFLQFSMILDFMLLAPLGAVVIPDLRITPSQFGLVVSAYAFSAGAAGILAAGFADRFDRKKLMLVFYCGFLAGTVLCGLAHSYELLLLARMIAGMFAGVVGAASMAIVTDLFPLQQRGRVMGLMQTAFGASSVLGLPIGLWLSNHWGWNAPFFMVAAVCAAVGVAIFTWLRPVDGHLQLRNERNPVQHLLHTLGTRRYQLGFLTTGLLSVGGFMLMPFMSVFMVHNLGLPLSDLPLVYMITGMTTMAAGPLIGRAADTFGKFRVFVFGCAMTISMVLIYTHLHDIALWMLVVVMVLLQIGIFSRMIPSTALMSALPGPADRGAYMSISSSLQQMSGGLAAVIGGLIVVQAPEGRLLHFDTVGYVLVCTTLVSLSLMRLVSRRIARAPLPG